MLDSLAFLIVPALIAFAILIAWIAGKYETKKTLERGEAMESWGRSHDMALLDRPNPNPRIFGSSITGVGKEKIEPFQPIKFLQMGNAHNFLEGTVQGRTVWVFDHRYVVSTGKSSHTVDHSLVAVGLRHQVPTFELRPHQFWDKIRAMFGHPDIEIHEPDFDRKYYISSTDEPYIQRLLDATLQDLMLCRDNTSWHCLNGFVLCIGYGQYTHEQLNQLLADALLLANKVDP